MWSLVLVAGVAVIVLVIAVVNTSSDQYAENSHLRRLNFVPVKVEATDYSWFTTQMDGTTMLDAVKSLLALLKDQDPKYQNIESDVALLNASVDALASQLKPTWTASHDLHFENSSLHQTLSEKLIGSSDKYKAGSLEWIRNYDERVDESFDVVVLTGLHFDKENWLSFLEAWKFMIEDNHLIIIQQGDPAVDIVTPKWLNYDLFNRVSVDKACGEHAWIFDWESDSPSLRSIGMLMGDKPFVYFLDRQSYPAMDSAGKPINPLEEHLINLRLPATPFYLNTPDHPFRWGSDFTRNYPYALRGGLPTAISIGHTIHSPPYDAITRLAKPLEKHYEPPGTGVATVAHGQFFSLSLSNVAVRAHMVGPMLYFPGVMKKNELDIGHQNEEAITGWAAKMIMDHIQGGVVIGGAGHVVRNESIVDIVTELKQDLVWAKYQEVVFHFFANNALHPKSAGSTSTAFMDVIDRMTEQLNKLHPAFAALSKAMTSYAHLWNQFHAFIPPRTIVASKSSIGPPESSKHKCGVVTIMHNEPIMLKVWTRYYYKHFHGAIFVADHMFNTSVHISKKELKEMEPDWSTILPGKKVTYWPLFGETHGYPVRFLASSAEKYQFRLLRAGYKCVLYTDVDEIIAPNPTKYPGGLNEYMENFVWNSTYDTAMTVSYNLAHVSQPDNGKPALEADMDWDKSLLSQRSYWIRNARYDKPLMSKIALRWKPGFHHLFVAKNINHDEDFVLFHLNEADEKFCMAREQRKYQVISYLARPDSFNGHIWKFPQLSQSGVTCRYAKGVFLTNKNSAVDNLGTVGLEKLDDKWKTVEM